MTYLFYEYSRNTISTWSSGTGGAGIIGAISYAGLIALGISSVNTMLIMLSVPFIEGVTFWILLRNPKTSISPADPKSLSKEKIDAACSLIDNRNDVECGDKNISSQPLRICEKLSFVPQLLTYMIPIMLVYLFEYFINQGLVRNFFTATHLPNNNTYYL